VPRLGAVLLLLLLLRNCSGRARPRLCSSSIGPTMLQASNYRVNLVRRVLSAAAASVSRFYEPNSCCSLDKSVALIRWPRGKNGNAASVRHKERLGEITWCNIRTSKSIGQNGGCSRHYRHVVIAYRWPVGFEESPLRHVSILRERLVGWWHQWAVSSVHQHSIIARGVVSRFIDPKKMLG